MQPTRISFIRYLDEGDEAAWNELNRIYRPMIVHWLRRYRLQAGDAEDIAQEVMATVARRVSDFDHNGRIGAFRKWLRTITFNVSQNFLKKVNQQPQGGGGSTFQEMLGQLQDPESDIAREFDLQHDHFMLLGLLDSVSSQFQPDTIEAFRLYVLEGVAADEIAERLGVQPHAVYMAKSRVLRSLRELAAEWIDEMSFS